MLVRNDKQRKNRITFTFNNFQKEEEESGDQFQMEITVTEPKKMGDGMGSYMAYKVNTKVSKCTYYKRNSNRYQINAAF